MKGLSVSIYRLNYGWKHASSMQIMTIQHHGYHDAIADHAVASTSAATDNGGRPSRGLTRWPDSQRSGKTVADDGWTAALPRRDDSLEWRATKIAATTHGRSPPDAGPGTARPYRQSRSR